MSDLEHAYALMLRICGVGIVIDAVERIANHRQYNDAGLFSWIVLRQRWAFLPSALRRVCDQALRGAGRLMVVLALRVLAVGLICATPASSPIFGAALTALLATHFFLGFRTAGFGTGGSDLMTLVICGSSWLTIVVASNPITLRAGLWFVVAQSCLGYTVAGVSKLKAPKWRSGAAVIAILSTHSYGSARLHALLSPRPRLSAVLCWTMMLWEATFAVVLVAPRDFVLPLLVLGTVFHASIAAVMGLNLFFFTFPATYAAIWAVRQ